MESCRRRRAWSSMQRSAVDPGDHRRTTKRLDDKYFTQVLLPDYIEENPERTAGWRVVYDARGHLIEPHTNRSVPLGTIEVATYLRQRR